MPKTLRALTAGLAEYVIQRENNRQIVFCNEESITKNELLLGEAGQNFHL
jgi:hypothetical protein